MSDSHFTHLSSLLTQSCHISERKKNVFEKIPVKYEPFLRTGWHHPKNVCVLNSCIMILIDFADKDTYKTETTKYRRV